MLDENMLIDKIINNKNLEKFNTKNLTIKGLTKKKIIYIIQSCKTNNQYIDSDFYYPIFKKYASKRLIYVYELKYFCNTTFTSVRWLFNDAKKITDINKPVMPIDYYVDIDRKDLVKIKYVLACCGYILDLTEIFYYIQALVDALVFFDIHCEEQKIIEPYDWMMFLHVYLSVINGNIDDEYPGIITNFIDLCKTFYRLYIPDCEDEDREIKSVEIKFISDLFNALAIVRPEGKVIKND